MNKNNSVIIKTGQVLQIKANSTINSSIDYKLVGYIEIDGRVHVRDLIFHIGITNSTSCAVLAKDWMGDCTWDRKYTIPELKNNKEPIIWSIVKTNSHLGVEMQGHVGWKFDISDGDACWVWKEDYDSLRFLETDNASIAYQILTYYDGKYELILHSINLFINFQDT